MKTTNIVNEEDGDKTYEVILHGLVARMNERILIGTFGSIRSDNEATRGYCLAMWLSESYTVKENTIMKVMKHNKWRGVLESSPQCNRLVYIYG